MRVIGMYYYTYYFGEHWRIIPDITAGYRVFEVQDAWAVINIPKDNRVVIRSDCAKCHIRRKDGGPLTEELANALVRDIATKDLVDLDQYDMALFEWERESIPVVNDSKFDIPFEVKIVTDDDEDGSVKYYAQNCLQPL